MFAGYWNDPEETARTLVDGWLHTGDLATRDDAEGYFSIVDRKKDLIITGGLNVYPAEVESVLYGVDGVREVAVVGVPHDQLGRGGRGGHRRRAGAHRGRPCSPRPAAGWPPTRSPSG